MVKAREGMQSKEILEEDTSTVMKKKLNRSHSQNKRPITFLYMIICKIFMNLL